MQNSCLKHSTNVIWICFAVILDLFSLAWLKVNDQSLIHLGIMRCFILWEIVLKLSLQSFFSDQELTSFSPVKYSKAWKAFWFVR